MKLHIEVTQEDIEEGICGDGQECMVALAVERATGRRFGFGYGDVELPDGGLKVGEVPEDVADKMWAFDLGHDVQPFAFDLELPDSLLTGTQA